MKRGDQYVQLSSFRVKSRVAPLTDGEPLEKPPEHAGEKVESFIFYYYGEELVMDVYKDYVKLVDSESVEWYYYKGAEFVFTAEAG